MTHPTFAAALRAALGAEGVSVYELAQRSGVSRQALGQYLAGNNQPTFAVVLKIAASLGITANDLTYYLHDGLSDSTM